MGCAVIHSTEEDRRRSSPYGLSTVERCAQTQAVPATKDIGSIAKTQGFCYMTALDLSMGYYHIPLDEYSQQLCTTILPWGKYRYKRLPMGVSNAPDIFQSIMQSILEFCRVYIDDILIVSDGTYEDHLEKLKQVLERLEQKGFRANVRKCFFARTALEYLGYWLTRKGIQPQPKWKRYADSIFPKLATN